MKLSWVDYGTLLSGLAFLVIHLLGCVRCKRKPSLPIAITAITAGGGLFFGAILVLTPFIEKLQSLPPRAEYLVIAGVAVLWVSVQYGWSLWAGRATATAEDVPPQSDSVNGEAAADIPVLSSTTKPHGDASVTKTAYAATVALDASLHGPGSPLVAIQRAR